MSCSKKAYTNGEPSILFSKLLDIVVDEIKAEELYHYIGTDQFKEQFGDYMTNAEEFFKEGRVDDNGEPFLHEEYGEHFFIDKDGNKMPYPDVSTRLQTYFGMNDIRTFSKSLAFAYYKELLKFDFTTFEFELKNDTSLLEFVKRKVDEIAEELIESGDWMKGSLLKDSNQASSEWAQRVKNFFNTIKLSYTEESITSNEEQTRESLFRKASITKDSKNNVNNNIKLLLSILEDETLDSFGQRTFVPFDAVYSILNKELANIVPVIDSNGILEDPFDLYVDKIREIAESRSLFKPLLDYLESTEVQSSEIFKNQFVSAFNLHKNNFLSSRVKFDKNNRMTHDVMNLSNLNSKASVNLSKWMEYYKKKKITTEKINNIIARINAAEQDLRTNEVDLETLDKILKEVGISVSNEAINFYLSANEGRVSKAISLYDGLKRSLKLQNKEVNIFKDQSVFRELAEAESFYSIEGTDAAIRTGAKNKWVYSYPSYIGKKLLKWKADHESFQQHQDSSAWTRGSYLMDLFYERPDLVQNIELGMFDSVNITDHLDIAPIDILSDYANKILKFKTGGKSYMKTPLAAGKSTQYQISYGINLDAEAQIVDGNIKVSDEVLDILFDYFAAEYNRMIEAMDPDSDVIVNYNDTTEGGAFKFWLFPEFNNNAIIDLFLDSETGNMMPLYDDIETMRGEIIPEIAKIVSTRIKEKLEYFKENELFETIDHRILEKYPTENRLERIAADLWTNSIVANVEYSMLFMGDPAFFKSNLDFKKRAPGTYSDGLHMARVRDENGNIKDRFKVGIISNVYAPSPVMDQLKKSLPAEVAKQYENINITDAQAWITPQRWKDIMIGLGKWSPQREETFKKMMSPNSKFTANELKFLAQPLKGVYYNYENGRPVYLKYSQAVLMPNLIQGTPLQRIYDQMKAKNIDEVVVQDGIKVGSPEPSTTHDSNTGEILENFEIADTSILNLSNEYWKLQQDLPTKGLTERMIGSQIQKIIFQGVINNLTDDFYVGDDNKATKGSDLIQHINDIYVDMVNTAQAEMQDELGIDANYKITNEKRFYSVMTRLMRMRNDVPENVIEGLERGVSPYGIPGFNEIFQNVFSSYWNKKIIRLSSPGAGYIQMSDYGITSEDAKNQKIIYTPWFKESRLAPPRLTGTTKIVETEYNSKKEVEVAEPGGIFLSGSLIAKYIPNYKDIPTPELFGKRNPDTGKYEGGIISEEILRNIIGYRIPDQDLASNDALQVMGILPEETGDTIIPYIGMTTKTGSDFDIDKIYFMMPHFRVKYDKALKLKSYIFNELKGDTLKQTIKNIDEVLGNVDPETTIDNIDSTSLAEAMQTPNKSTIKYNGELLNIKIGEFISAVLSDPNSDLAKKIQKDVPNLLSVNKLEYIPYDANEGVEGNSKKALRNRILEIYKSILTHPNVLPKVMTSIDASYIKDDIKALTTSDNSNVFDGFADVELDVNFLQGRFGIGQAVNQLVDAVRGRMTHDTQDKDLNSGLHVAVSRYSTGIPFAKYTQRHPKDKLRYAIDKNNLQIADKKVPSSLRSLDLFNVITAYVNGFVDVEKDPYVIQGNWTTVTNPVGFTMLRAGVHPFIVNAYLNQPSLKGYVRQLSNAYNISKPFKSFERNPIYQAKLYKLKIGKKLLPDFNVSDTITIKDMADVAFDVELFDMEVERARLMKEAARSSNPMEAAALIEQAKEIQTNMQKMAQDAFLTVNNKSLDELIKTKRRVAFEHDGIMGRIKKPQSFLESRFSGNIKPGETVYAYWKNNPKAFITNLGIKEDGMIHYDVKPAKAKMPSGYTSEKLREGINMIMDQISIVAHEDDMIGNNLTELRESSKSVITQENLRDQIAVINSFIKMRGIASSVNDGVYISRVDTDGKGKNITSTFIRKNRYHLMQDKNELINFDSKLMYNNSPTLLKGYFDQVMNLPDLFMSNPKFFIMGNPAVQNTFNLLSSAETKTWGDKQEVLLVDEKKADKYERAYYTYLMSGFIKKNTPEGLRNLYENFPKEFEKMKEQFPENLLLNELWVEEQDGVEMIRGIGGKKSVTYMNDLVDAWRELFIQNEKFAEDLIKYAYMQSGFNKTQRSFHEYIPTEWWTKNKFNEYLDGLNQYYNEYDTDFLGQYYRNNYEELSVTSNGYPNSDPLPGEKYKGKGFINKKAGTFNSPMMYTIRLTDPTDMSVSTTHYLLSGYTIDGKGVYRRVSVLEGNEYMFGIDNVISRNPKRDLPKQMNNNEIYETVRSIIEFEVEDGLGSQNKVEQMIAALIASGIEDNNGLTNEENC